ncbi:Hypothetical protein A7982_05970 [Minicystis rosea]|nr:Hypothetical protein A7982_05970 [Minicystis rosea]
MRKTIRGTFDVKLTPQEAGNEIEKEAAVGRMTIDKRFTGDLEATSKGQMLAVRTAVTGSAGYVALERVTGSLSGRTGTFYFQHDGKMNRGEASLDLTVVPDSGTEGLTGLQGSMTIEITGGKHFYTFDYELPDAG